MVESSPNQVPTYLGKNQLLWAASDLPDFTCILVIDLHMTIVSEFAYYIHANAIRGIDVEATSVGSDGTSAIHGCK